MTNYTELTAAEREFCARYGFSIRRTEWRGEDDATEYGYTIVKEWDESDLFDLAELRAALAELMTKTPEELAAIGELVAD